MIGSHEMLLVTLATSMSNVPHVKLNQQGSRIKDMSKANELNIRLLHMAQLTGQTCMSIPKVDTNWFRNGFIYHLNMSTRKFI